MRDVNPTAHPHEGHPRMQCLPTHATRSAILGRLEWLGWLGRQSAVLSHRDAGSAGARLNGCTHRRTVVGRNSHRINAANRRRAMRALREYAACPRIIAESILCSLATDPSASPGRRHARGAARPPDTQRRCAPPRSGAAGPLARMARHHEGLANPTAEAHAMRAASGKNNGPNGSE